MVRTRPLVVAAAISTILFSAVGIAALTGVLPAAQSKPDPSAASVVGLPPAMQLAVAPVAATPAMPAAPARAAPARKPACGNCGVIASVQAAEVKGEGSGVGAVAGGVAGAVVGNQFGRGDGRAVMTIAGAAGGALAGNEIEKHVKKRTVYRVTVRMDDGRMVKLSRAEPPAFAVGERVRVNGNALERG